MATTNPPIIPNEITSHHHEHPPPAKKIKKTKYLTRKQANALLLDSGEAIQAALKDIATARELATLAGLTVESVIVPTKIGDVNPPLHPEALTTTTTTPATSNAVLLTTGGHSNTDHVVVRTGDEKLDRLAELKRNLVRRSRAMQPEHRRDDRWDRPRIPGERRRRILREKDLPESPPEPPPSGYVVFVGQMTTKIRHDRPHVRHDQAKVMQEISKIWRLGMSDSDRQYYNEFADEARKEYEQQQIEYRATGSYTPSTQFQKLEGVNVWLRAAWQEKNGLERELSGYEKVVFPKRPPEFDREYERKLEESKIRRKLKLKGLLHDNGTVKEGAEEFLEKEATEEWIPTITRDRRLVIEHRIVDEEQQEEQQEIAVDEDDGHEDEDAVGAGDEFIAQDDEEIVSTHVIYEI